MARAKQSGSMVSFVIVGVILALLLIGGVYFIRRSLAPTSDGVPSSSENETDTTKEVDSTDNTDQSSDESLDIPDISLPGRTDNETPDGQGNTEQLPADLPQTGPTDVLLGGILLSGIAGAGVAYKRSRKLRTSL